MNRSAAKRRDRLAGGPSCLHGAHKFILVPGDRKFSPAHKDLDGGLKMQ